MIFNKKQKQMPNYDYTKWESDFGFLLLMISRKTGIAKEFNIRVFGAQLQNKNDFIKDKDIEEIYQNTVNDIYTNLSPNYISYLSDKYFGSEKGVIGFISEAVLDELIKESVSTNNEKIKRQYVSQMTENISDLNNGGTVKKEK